MQSDHRKYQVLEPVGRGGFGTVYRAQLLGAGGFEKIVALKVLNTDIDGAMDFAERLRDEARMLGLLQHRSIVRVDGLQQLNGRWTVVMEYVPGVDLKRLLTLGPMPIGPALELMEEVADALYSAYERPGPQGEPLHLLHRDIKPSNIHLTPAGEVKVLDFGVARADFKQRESITRSFFFGSLAYMAPERLDGIDTHAGDVYSLGSVLFELLSGISLGRTSGHAERHAGILNEGMAQLKDLGDDRIEALLRRALAYEPEDRLSARELTREIRGLRSTHAEPWLRDWAEEVVPGLRESQDPVQDDLSGSILIEQTGLPKLDMKSSNAWSEGSIPKRGAGETWIQEIIKSDEPDKDLGEAPGSGAERIAADLPPEPDTLERTRPKAAMTGLLAGVGLALILILIGASVYLVWDAAPWETSRERPRKKRDRDSRVSNVSATGTVDRAQEKRLSNELEPVPGTGMDQLSEPELVFETEPVSEPEPASTEATTEPELESTSKPDSSPERSPPVEPLANGTVRASGAIVELWADGEIWQTGSMPAGTYAIWAFFSGTDQPATRAGSLTLEAGQEIMLTCNAPIQRCVEVSY